jgi:two-component system sensor histidine kinase MtrB
MFALGALILSVSVGALSYFTARHFLLGERESSSVQTAYVHASVVAQRIVDGAKPVTVLASVDAGTTGSFSILEWDADQYERTASVGPSAIPGSVRTMVAGGTASTQTFLQDGKPAIAVGIPLVGHGAYYEIFVITDLEHTLNVLAGVLFGAGLVTTLLGAALGRWASGRSLRPLSGVSRAAVAIAGGQLDTRLAALQRDPELAALATSFNRMVDQLQERIEREARFASDVSHELRSPLTTLANSLEVLESRADELSASGRRALELLSADLRRFQRMVRDLLEISRSDAGSKDASFEEVDPGELVRRAVDAAQRSLPPETPMPEVHVDPEVAGTRLWVDKRRFERVVSNLLENAALYGGGATDVRVAAAQPANGHARAVRVSVEDAGAGLPPAERAKVFERFYRGHAAYQRSTGTGTGLGLALVAEHVRLHGGTVWADESPAGGARFTVELPGEAAPEGDEEEEPAAPSEAAP